MIHKRGQTFHYSETLGGRRIRVSLGTSDKSAAQNLAARVSRALVDGDWSSLRSVLPPASYRSLASGSAPDLSEFEKLFHAHLERREKLGEIAANSRRLYQIEADRFFAWLRPRFQLLENITPSVIQQYRTERQDQISTSPHFKNGRGLLICTAVLRAIFKFAVEEGYLKSSPVKSGGAVYGESRGAEPFTPQEMRRLDLAVEDYDELVHLLFKWTGLRGSDAAAVTWGAITLGEGLLKWKTIKRGKTVTIPLAEDLRKMLVYRYDLLQPDLDEPVLGYGTTRAKLYSIIRNLGERAGVKNCSPHKYRDHLAVTILERGGTIYDVAKILGDTVATVEKHYAPFTDRLQERVRGILDQEAAAK